jgi:uncharacterized membrane protein
VALAPLRSRHRQRLGFGLLGGLLVASGVWRPSRGGLAKTAAGVLLIAHAVSGQPDLIGGLRAATGRGRHVEVHGTITIGRAADELYRAWRDPQVLSQVLGPVVEVRAPSTDVLQWEVAAPGGRALASDIRIVEERPGELLRWESLPGSAVPIDGSTAFAPTHRGTEVTLRLRLRTPAGPAARWLERELAPGPGALARKALRRFKSLAETGEIATTERNPSARRGGA